MLFSELAGIGIQPPVPGCTGGEGGRDGAGGGERPTEAGGSNHRGVHEAGEAEGTPNTSGRQVRVYA